MFTERKDFYEYTKPEADSRTRQRLEQLERLGCIEVGAAQFGIPNLFSGLYIENVWSFSEQEWNSYIDWVNSLTAAQL